MTVGKDGEIPVTDPSNVDSTVALVPAMGADDITAVYDAAEREREVVAPHAPASSAQP